MLVRLFEVRSVCLLAVLLASGCRLQPPPDPNDPRNAAPDKVAEVLRKQIKNTADELNDRVIEGQLTDPDRLELLSQKAETLLAEGHPQDCQPKDAWIYADLYITDSQFDKAIPLLKKAVDYETSIKDDDRRVNDSLRLAKCEARIGDVPNALQIVQGVIDSKPSDPGPILPAVLLEITPAAEGKGHDEELAKLLEESIHEHLRMKVDPKSVAGTSFLLARPYHIRNAWKKIVSLLQSSGHPDEAQAAETRAQEMMKQFTDSTVT